MKSSTFWWLLTIAGGLLISLGIFSLLSPLHAYIFMVHYSGLALLFNGLILLIVSLKSTSALEEKEWLLAEGGLDIFFAVCLLFNPFLTFIAFTLLIGPWMIGKGILKTIAVLKIRQIRGGIFILLAGLLSVIFGLLIIFYPLEKANGITIFIGLFTLIMGVLYVFDSIRFRKLTDTIELMM
jgi:uncharacterized membrane protein HdeD (DUF308 family)